MATSIGNRIAYSMPMPGSRSGRTSGLLAAQSERDASARQALENQFEQTRWCLPHSYVPDLAEAERKGRRFGAQGSRQADKASEARYFGHPSMARATARNHTRRGFVSPASKLMRCPNDSVLKPKPCCRTGTSVAVNDGPRQTSNRYIHVLLLRLIGSRSSAVVRVMAIVNDKPQDPSLPCQGLALSDSASPHDLARLFRAHRARCEPTSHRQHGRATFRHGWPSGRDQAGSRRFDRISLSPVIDIGTKLARKIDETSPIATRPLSAFEAKHSGGGGGGGGLEWGGGGDGNWYIISISLTSSQGLCLRIIDLSAITHKNWQAALMAVLPMAISSEPRYTRGELCVVEPGFMPQSICPLRRSHRLLT